MKKMALGGKIALVTGAAMGIGRAMTEELLSHGAKVALLDVNTESGKTLVQELETKFGKGKVLFLECNVQSEEQVKAAFQKTVQTFGGIDIVCNNAGILNEKDWEKTVSINLLGLIRVSYLALDHMSLKSGGRGGIIVHTASLAGLGPLPCCPVYTATKHGVVGFTRAMALASLASEFGVRFNALCPGFVNTDLFTSIPEKLGQWAHMADLSQSLVETMGVMSVSSVAEGLMELLLDETKTGQALVIQPDGRKYVEFPSQASVTPQSKV